MKKAWKVLIGLSVAVLLMGGVVTFLEVYYSSHFAVNTWVEGIYCTGKTVEEINQELKNKIQAPDLCLTDRFGNTTVLSPEEWGYNGDYSSFLKENLLQGHFSWITGFFEEKKVMIPKDFYPFWTYRLEEGIKDSAVWKIETESDYAVKLVRTEEENLYLFSDGKKQRLNLEKAVDAVSECLNHGETAADLLLLGCYEDMAYTPEDLEVQRQYEELIRFLDSGCTYDMGEEQIVLERQMMDAFLKKDAQDLPVFDPDGKLVLKTDAAENFVDRLCLEYNTAGTTRDFQTTEGRVVQVTYKDQYGTELDAEAEISFMEEFLEKVRNGSQKAALVHTPVYAKETWHHGRDDLGDTYVEVDMANQHIYYYQDGECLVDADVVTGNMRRRTTTPSGIYAVYGKQRNRTLRGKNYTSFVKYWIPFYNHYGIHDASWRKEFGGDIYLTDGSHGCVNTPTEQVSRIYDLIEIGTPVILFYE